MKKATILLLLTFVSSQFLHSQNLFEKLAEYGNKVEDEAIYIQTDRPFYESNETVWITLWVRNSITLKPSSKSSMVNVKILDPRGEVVSNIPYQLKKGCATSSFRLNQTGGIYTVVVYSNYGNHLDSTKFTKKEIQVQNIYRSPVLFTNDLNKNSYNPGENVKGVFQIRDGEGSPLRFQDVEVELFIDGQKFAVQSFTTDNQGFYHPEFKLPERADIQTASFQCKTKHLNSPISKFKLIPLSGVNLELMFFPEGGWMIHNLNSKIAFKALDMNGNPASVKGQIFCEGNEIPIVNFSSEHDGMGVFKLKPDHTKKYYAVITLPTNNKKIYELPLVKNEGTMLQVDKIESNQLHVSFQSSHRDTRTLALRQGEKVVHSCSFEDKSNAAITIPTEKLGVGVHKLTLFDSEMNPICERLVFVNAHKKLQVNMSTDKEIYSPNEKVKMKIEVKDIQGKPVKTQFAMSVVNEQILQFSEKYRENIASSFLLQNELRGKIHKPGYYFSSTEPDVLAHLDLLMMTHGWRRIEWEDVKSDNLPLLSKSNSFKNRNYMIMGELRAIYSMKNDIPKEMISKGKLTLTINKQNIPLTADGRFAIWGLDPNIEYSFTYKLNGYYKYSFNVSPWEFKVSTETIGYGVTYKEKIKDTVRLSSSNKSTDSKIGNLNPQKIFNKTKLAALQHEELDNGSLLLPKASQIEMDDSKKSLSEIYIDGLPTRNIHSISGLTVLQSPVSGYYYHSNMGHFIYYSTNDHKRHMDNVFHFKPSTQFKINYSSVISYYKSESEGLYEFNYKNKNIILYIHEIETNAEGEKTIEFRNGNEFGSFQANFEGIGDNGLTAFQSSKFTISKPLLIEFETPMYLTEGDIAEIPIVIKNNRNKIQSFKYSCYIGSYKEESMITLLPNDIFEKVIHVNSELFNKKNSIKLSLKISQSEHNETIEKNIEFQKSQNTKNYSISRMKVGGKEEFEIRDSFELESLSGSLNIFTSLSNDILKSAENMVRQPSGCFEQVSSVNYPNIMVWQLLKYNRNSNDRLYRLIEDGYKKLVAYETDEKGFEWYGRTPPHEGLTAYGLLQFWETNNSVFDIDKKMYNRNINWLKSRFNNDGSINTNQGKYGFSGASNVVTCAYVSWVLSQIDNSENSDLSKQIEYLEKNVKKEFDAYTMALLANIYINLNQTEKGTQMLSTLVKHIKEKGFEKLNANHSITRSYGSSLDIEIMSLVAIGLSNSNFNTDFVNDIVIKIYSKKNNYGYFGSTQATVLFYKAVILWNQLSNPNALSHNKITLKINGKTIDSVFVSKNNGTSTLSIKSDYFQIGKNTIEVGLEKSTFVIYQALWSHRTLQKQKPSTTLQIESSLPKETVNLSDYVQINYKIKNLSKSGLPQTVAVIPIPAGLSLIPEQLKMLYDNKIVDFYEIKNEKIYLYWSELGPSEIKNLPLGFKAQFKGKFFSSGAHAYIYYNQEVISYLDDSFITILN